MAECDLQAWDPIGWIVDGVLKALILLEEWPIVICKPGIPLDKFLMVFFESSNPIEGMADCDLKSGDPIGWIVDGVFWKL
jgi:hypothetical protein